MISLALAAVAAFTPAQQLDRAAQMAYVMGRCVAWTRPDIERANVALVSSAGKVFRDIYDQGVRDASRHPISAQTCGRAIDSFERR